MFRLAQPHVRTKELIRVTCSWKNGNRIFIGMPIVDYPKRPKLPYEYRESRSLAKLRPYDKMNVTGENFLRIWCDLITFRCRKTCMKITWLRTPDVGLQYVHVFGAWHYSTTSRPEITIQSADLHGITVNI